MVILSPNICRSNTLKPAKKFDFQGHRGCRGLFPENSIDGFIEALRMGVTTLEMDVVISRDRHVICSHDPWFSHFISTDPQGLEFLEADEIKHLIFEKTLEEIAKYDCGLKFHASFPNQQKRRTQKPTLSAVIDAAEAFAKETGRTKPFYNIETKCTPEGDFRFHPEPGDFSELLLKVVFDRKIEKRAIIQSFDIRSLRYIRKNYPRIKLSLLIENEQSAEENLRKLGFVPAVYSPDYELVTLELVKFCRKMNMKLIPWTVNEESDMVRLIEMGVDGLISDYPNKFANLIA